MDYTASNGYRLSQAPMTKRAIHQALGEAEAGSDRYWALIEYLDYHKTNCPDPKPITLEEGGHIAFYG